MRFLAAVFLGSLLAGAIFTPVLAASSIDLENNPKFKEVYRIKVWNLPGGTVEVSSDEGKTWEHLGSVVYPTVKTNAESYKASRWIDDGKVAATAVNAIHIKTATASPDGSGIVFSLLPKEFLRKQRNYRSYLSPDSSIYTDIPAGESIFGGGHAPFVGNIVMVSQPGQRVIPLPKDYVPQLGDKIYIMVDLPVEYPKEIVFENQFGGKITIRYFGGGEREIGRVLRPVVGVGRFEGTKYASVGRIRADHAGVIDVSTSPLGRIGGFQIVPAQHGSEMKSVLEMTQWMVIGAVETDNASLEGKAPFFKYFIKPSYKTDDLESVNWQGRFLDRFLVEVKLKGSDQWQPMPAYEFNEYYLTGEIPGWADDALQNITHFRILFPIKNVERSLQ
jgi:hypothetical protein